MKKNKVLISPEAFADIREINSWYEEQQEGLGLRFQEEVIRMIDFLRINPSTFTVRYKNIRCALVRKFPFMIHYTIADKGQLVKVLAVISTSRNPQVWKRKTGN